MMSRMFGAPLGGTTDGGQYGLESLTLSLMTPPNGNGGGGICFPSIVTVALGAAGVPLICWADAGGATNNAADVAGSNKAVHFSLCVRVCLSLLHLKTYLCP